MRDRQMSPHARAHPVTRREAVTGAIVLLGVFALAMATLLFAQMIPARAVAATAGHSVSAGEGYALAASVKGRPPITRGLGYMVPRQLPPAPGGQTGSLRDQLRSFGLLRAYSEPPDRVVFDPSGAEQFLPVPPVPGAPRVAGAVYHGNRAKPRIALTFDDGYYGMGKLIGLLVELRLPATLFPTGAACAEHKGYILEASKLGFEIGNHSWTHLMCTKAPGEVIAREITASEDVVNATTGQGMVGFFRPPYGNCDDRVTRVAGSLGFLVVQWSRDTLDWSPSTTTEQLISRATDGVQNGDIILMHSQGQHTLEALPTIVKILRDKGFELTTVSGVLAP
jgi:peptidoglycan/xylan/chitin deacetylase (PgdA/CDA1 family)